MTADLQDALIYLVFYGRLVNISTTGTMTNELSRAQRSVLILFLIHYIDVTLHNTVQL